MEKPKKRRSVAESYKTKQNLKNGMNCLLHWTDRLREGYKNNDKKKRYN